MNNGTRPRSSTKQGVAWGRKELADSVGCTDRTIRYWLGGNSQPISTQDIERVFFGNDNYHPFSERIALREARDRAEKRKAENRRTPVVATNRRSVLKLDNFSPETSDPSKSAEDKNVTVEKLTELCSPYAGLSPEAVGDGHLGSLISQVSSRPLAPDEIEYSIYAYRKLCEDLNRSMLIAPQILLNADEKAKSDLVLLLNGNAQETKFHLIDVATIASSSWRGRLDADLLKRARTIPHFLGRKIRLNVSSASPATCAVATWFDYLNIPLEVDSRDASGREQAIRLKSNSDNLPDFTIGADAPILISVQDHTLPYIRKLDVHAERQKLLIKKGTGAEKVSTLFLYPSSTAVLQLKATYEYLNERFGINENTHEVPIELSDYPIVAQQMQPGDGIFAWRPLLDRLAARFDLEPQEGTEFSHCISLYQRADWNEGPYRNHAETFIECFLTIWNDATRKPLQYWLALVSRSAFLDDFGNSVVGIHS